MKKIVIKIELKDELSPHVLSRIKNDLCLEIKSGLLQQFFDYGKSEGNVAKVSVEVG